MTPPQQLRTTTRGRIELQSVIRRIINIALLYILVGLAFGEMDP